MFVVLEDVKSLGLAADRKPHPNKVAWVTNRSLKVNICFNSM